MNLVRHYIEQGQIKTALFWLDLVNIKYWRDHDTTMR